MFGCAFTQCTQRISRHSIDLSVKSCFSMEMSEIAPNPSEAILKMQDRHRQALELNGIIGKVAEHAIAENRQDTTAEVLEGYPVVLGSTYEDVTQIYVAFQNEAGVVGQQRLSSRIVRIGAIAAGKACPNVFMGITDADFAVVHSLYNDALYHKEHIAPDYDVEFGL